MVTVCAGILYTFSGYVLQYYTNIPFLDFVILLPIVVYALEQLLTEHKYLPFSVMMFFRTVLFMYVFVAIFGDSDYGG